MAKYLKDKDITIVTTNALILPELENAKCKCVMIGGDLILAAGGNQYT